MKPASKRAGVVGNFMTCQINGFPARGKVSASKGCERAFSAAATVVRGWAFLAGGVSIIVRGYV